MWFRIHTLAIEAKVFREVVQEAALMCWHRFHAETLLGFISSKHAELAFLIRAPFRMLSEEVECLSRVWYVVVGAIC